MFSKVQVLFRQAFAGHEQHAIVNTIRQCCPFWELVFASQADTSLILCIGGDGTLLRGVKARVNADTPVLGVNVGGHLGYLTADTDLIRALTALNQGQYLVAERTMVSVQVKEQGTVVARLEALNEVVVRGENNKPIEVNVSVAGSSLENVFGDGLMISTPTGSTAYNLSVGGPLVDSLCPVLLITPIAPIDLNIRPIVIPDHQELTLSLTVWSGERKFIFADREEYALHEGQYELAISKAEQNMKVIEFPTIKDSFFQVLHDRTLGQRQGG